LKSNGLKARLKSNGLKARVKNGKVSVRLDGLSNPVSIVKDISDDECKVKTNDSVITVFACFSLFLGLSGIYEGSGKFLISCAFVSMAIASFFSVLLTEVKLTRLRAILTAYNRGEHD
ncbi:hypothetical protein, partial [Salinivibrio sp. IB872]|uniref:hypothetical protein n=1 Tax=Salinivibrio sp. IB872 TaxID=1766123 RepID=UPI0009C4C17C